MRQPAKSCRLWRPPSTRRTTTRRWWQSTRQEELGFRASLHRTEICELERATRVPRIDTLIKLAGALSVPPGDLLKGMAWRAGGARVGCFTFRSVRGAN
jgi:transcriptional regulator with XRE-family HTH domain